MSVRPEPVAALPARALPFPVTATHAMRPDLRRLDGPLLTLDALAPDYLAAKLTRLRATPARCLALRDPPAADREAALAGVLDRLADEAPSAIGASPVLRVDDGWRLPLPGVRLARADWAVRADPPGLGGAAGGAGSAGDLAPAAIAAWLSPLAGPLRAMHAIGLALQDDWALMRLDADDGGARAEALHVCLPSGWDPAEKAGRDFAAIHAPVADADALRAASRALSAAIVRGGPYERHVWTISDGPALARHPAETRPASPRGIEDLWFRCERQATVPLPPLGRAIFLIRVHMAPLAEAAADAERRATLAAALRSMTPAVVAYKGLAAARELVLQRW